MTTKPNKNTVEKKPVTVTEEWDVVEEIQPHKHKDPLSAWVSPNDIEIEKEPTPIEIMINEMLNTNNLETKTDLSDNLIVALTKGTIFADLYDNDIMRSLVKTVSLYRISRNRLGRGEIKDMAKSLGTASMEENPSFMSRLFKGE